MHRETLYKSNRKGWLSRYIWGTKVKTRTKIKYKFIDVCNLPKFDLY